MNAVCLMFGKQLFFLLKGKYLWLESSKVHLTSNQMQTKILGWNYSPVFLGFLSMLNKAQFMVTAIVPEQQWQGVMCRKWWCRAADGFIVKDSTMKDKHFAKHFFCNYYPKILIKQSKQTKLFLLLLWCLFKKHIFLSTTPSSHHFLLTIDDCFSYYLPLASLEPPGWGFNS